MHKYTTHPGFQCCCLVNWSSLHCPKNEKLQDSFHQNMHPFIKHIKCWNVQLKYLFAPICFGPIGPSSGSVCWALLKPQYCDQWKYIVIWYAVLWQQVFQAVMCVLPDVLCATQIFDILKVYWGVFGGALSNGICGFLCKRFNEITYPRVQEIFHMERKVPPKAYCESTNLHDTLALMKSSCYPLQNIQT